MCTAITDMHVQRVQQEPPSRTPRVAQTGCRGFDHPHSCEAASTNYRAGTCSAAWARALQGGQVRLASAQRARAAGGGPRAPVVHQPLHRRRRAQRVRIAALRPGVCCCGAAKALQRHVRAVALLRSAARRRLLKLQQGHVPEARSMPSTSHTCCLASGVDPAASCSSGSPQAQAGIPTIHAQDQLLVWLLQHAAPQGPQRWRQPPRPPAFPRQRRPPRPRGHEGRGRPRRRAAGARARRATGARSRRSTWGRSGWGARSAPCAAAAGAAGLGDRRAGCQAGSECRELRMPKNQARLSGERWHGAGQGRYLAHCSGQCTAKLQQLHTDIEL